MANETIITVAGNLTSDPELRFTQNGTAVANFTIASTPRRFDKQSGEWQDQEPLFVRCSVWREYAENVAESLTKGMAVIAQGRLKANSYEDKDGNNRTGWELEVDEVGPTLRYATAQVQRRQKNQPGPSNVGSQGGFGQPAQQAQRPGPNDPWAGGQQQSWGNAPQDGNPPF